MTPFQPIGTVARWRIVYDLLEPLTPGTKITYQELAEALGLDADRGLRTIQQSTRRAAQEFLRVQQHALDTIPRVGYVVVEAEEHLNIARRHQRKAGKALVRGHQHVEHVDLNALDVETRHAFSVVAAAFAQQRAVVDRLNVKQRRLEEAMAAMAPKVERSESEIEQLKERLRKLENGIRET